MAALGMQFVTIASSELVGLKIAASVQDAVGMDEKDIANLDDPARVRDVVEKWNTFAASHRPLPRMVVYDRGARSEILIGSRA